MKAQDNEMKEIFLKQKVENHERFEDTMKKERVASHERFKEIMREV